MPTSTSEVAEAGPDLAGAIRRRAIEEGFDIVGIAAPGAVAAAGERLDDFLAEGRHGDMDWLAAKADRRRHPNALWPAARSIIVLGLNYGPLDDPAARPRASGRAAVSVYADRRDYHDVVKKRLKRLGRWLQATAGGELKVFVDTAPVLEKPLARAAGLGWQGKHTNLVSREFGSWLFLGTIYTTLELPADPGHADRCGDCRACLEVCPTDAFPAPYQLDARRCISYLTIEHQGHIDRRYRAAIGNRVFGCDDCLAVCPWNKYARAAHDLALAPKADLGTPALADLLALDDDAFRCRFAGTPVKRLGRDRFLRNGLIAAGNSGAPDLAPRVEPLLRDPSPLVRAMAVWALSRLLAPDAFAELTERHLPDESDSAVRAEWRGIA
ncbi:MAG: tRNA epoxyqueuosine(34) reductase QueG [Alphaproteobacteria bacterium]|jgi:epoxyqueuosine reductase|nr:tRNA epoxyqueuosine(34) reductase QueG [Alphaproteobacteria bacterium]MDP6813696.1 tRNA epoxyqueuosine(34) reductase QueG [Alphaproteobacteria bacterium]